MQRADVGMSQAGNHFGLALEALASGSVVGEMWRKNLDGDSAVEASIADPINLSPKGPLWCRSSGAWVAGIKGRAEALAK